MPVSVVIRKKVLRDPLSDKPVLPATIVVLHGWGFDSASMQPLAEPMSQWSDVWFIDLYFNNQTIASLVEALIAILPKNALMIGWSLGAMLAVNLAFSKSFRNEQKNILGLISLSANAKFVASELWPSAMAADTFNQFLLGMKNFPEKQIKQFAKLIALGDFEKKNQLNWLQNKISQQDDFLYGLEILNSIDNCMALSSLCLPHLIMLGENDTLVPSDCMDGIKNNYCDVNIIKNRGHCLHYPITETYSLIDRFLENFCRD